MRGALSVSDVVYNIGVEYTIRTYGRTVSYLLFKRVTGRESDMYCMNVFDLPLILSISFICCSCSCITLWGGNRGETASTPIPSAPVTAMVTDLDRE